MSLYVSTKVWMYVTWFFFFHPCGCWMGGRRMIGDGKKRMVGVEEKEGWNRWKKRE